MQRKQLALTIAFGVAFLVGVVGIVFFYHEEVTGMVANENTYDISEVLEHSGAESCWTVVNGSVYDLTAWISKHPGGDKAILSLCGSDGTRSFMAQHGNFEPAQLTLITFKIGELAPVQ